MQAAFDRTTLDRLIALGRSRGELTPDDLRRALPVDRMSAEDIALVLIELEEAGIAVDPDEILLQGGGTPLPAGAIRLPEPPVPAPAAPVVEPPPAAATAATTSAPDRVSPPPARGGAHRAVILAGLAALALAVLVLTLWALRG
ncbi:MULTISPECIES: RNA polymerase sigma factor region1.1 domain-containing protein [Methylobacterium]|uniref:RNA polymerase sigma factor region1.1 domain-containing protein n=1 Tax=Methylobacterium TaxID=407 RepID=UPI00272DCEB6|nr:RNA polymerase sigma factor region1.1 domain-containing protein [Methylobacterium sp.]